MYKGIDLNKYNFGLEADDFELFFNFACDFIDTEINNHDLKSIDQLKDIDKKLETEFINTFPGISFKELYPALVKIMQVYSRFDKKKEKM